MLKKNAFDEPQFWRLLMVVAPMIVLMNVGNVLTNSVGLRILFAGVAGGVGALLGIGADYFTREKGRVVKALATLGLLVLSVAVFWVVATRQSDDKIVQQPWKTQTIGTIAFSAPELLDFRSNQVPEPLQGVYTSMSTYTLEEENRLMLFLQSEIVMDTLGAQTAFDGALLGMLQPLGIGSDEIQKVPVGNFEHAVAYKFSFTKNGKVLQGFGCVYSWEHFLESIWLLPKTAGYSDAYIDKFIADLEMN